METGDILMPKLGLTMTEGSVSEWNVAPGDRIAAGQVVLVIETDKVTHDVEAERDGVLAEIVVPQGETVAVGTVLARMEVAASAAATPPPAAVEPAARANVPTPVRKPKVSIADVRRRPAARTARDDRVIATPLARKRAADAGVNLREVAGSGPGGRIKAADVEATRAAPAPSPDHGADRSSARTRAPSATQAVMARRLAESKHGVPHFYLASEAEVTALETQRAARHTGGDTPKLTLTPFLVAAVARALVDLPDANTVWADGALITFGSVDVGLAVHTPRGLYVPIVRDAGAKPIDVIAREARRLAQRAREGELGAADMSGGAVTVSNAGMHDVTYMTPIIAPGQSAILGVGSIREVFRPDAEGRPALRRELGLVFAADHRVFDGVSALHVLNRIIYYLEAPALLAGG